MFMQRQLEPLSSVTQLAWHCISFHVESGMTRIIERYKLSIADMKENRTDLITNMECLQLR